MHCASQYASEQGCPLTRLSCSVGLQCKMDWGHILSTQILAQVSKTRRIPDRSGEDEG